MFAFSKMIMGVTNDPIDNDIEKGYCALQWDHEWSPFQLNTNKSS